MPKSPTPLPFIKQILFACLFAVFGSCSKEDVKLNTNQFKPINNNISENLLSNVDAYRMSPSVIIKTISFNNDGIAFLGRNGDRYFIGKLSNKGFALEYCIELNFKALDMTSNKGHMFGLPSPANMLYVSSDGDPGSIHEFDLSSGTERNPLRNLPKLSNISSLLYFAEDYRLYFTGTNAANRPTVYWSSFNRLDSLVLDTISSTIRGMKFINSDSTIVAYYDSSKYFKFSRIFPFEKKVETMRINSYSPLYSTGKQTLSANGNLVVFSMSHGALYSPTFFIQTKTFGSISNMVFGIQGLGNTRSAINDMVIRNDTIYSCGISHYYEFNDYKNTVGNALLVRTVGTTSYTYTFGDDRFLSCFNSIEIAGEYLILSGYTEQYFGEGNNAFWFTNYSSSKPFLIRVPLSLL